MNKPKQPVILIADDEKNILYAFKKTFRNEGKVITAVDGEEALKVIKAGIPSLVFMDITMPKKDGLSVLKEVSAEGIDIPIIIITGYGTMDTAVEAMKLGAFDYITKPLDIINLRVVASRALNVVNLKKELQDLELEVKDSYHENEMIGSHPSMQKIFKSIGLVANTPNTTNVFITGDSGTGKELVAKAIHRAGNHNSEPFLGINCTVLPENLLESELFGHKKGAFTGAIDHKKGKFKIAGKGTIFLDEIGDMPILLQQRFLRVLEEREFVPVGSNKPVAVEARFITATNQDIEKLMKKEEFREDLFYRLNVFHIHLPPLRQRKDDIPSLINFFIAKENKAMKKHIKTITDEVMKDLMAYDYPGNVRELKNIITTAVTQEQGDVITSRSLPLYFYKVDSSMDYKVPIKSVKLKEARSEAVRVFEEQFVRYILKLAGGNVTKAASMAEIERQSFQRLMRKFGIRSQDFRVTG